MTESFDYFGVFGISFLDKWKFGVLVFDGEDIFRLFLVFRI